MWYPLRTSLIMLLQNTYQNQYYTHIRKAKNCSCTWKHNRKQNIESESEQNRKKRVRRRNAKVWAGLDCRNDAVHKILYIDYNDVFRWKFNVVCLWQMHTK